MALYFMSQAGFWDPQVTVVEGTTAKNLVPAANVAGLAAQLEEKANETGRIEDVWEIAYWRMLAVESFPSRTDYNAAARLASSVCRLMPQAGAGNEKGGSGFARKK